MEYRCGICGGTDVYFGAGMVWCATSLCSQPLGEIRVGLIEGRHDMPVDGYLLPASTTDKVGYHQGVLDEARDAAEKFVRENGHFSLYLTGLTVAGIGAVEGMKKAGISHPELYNFDSATKEYVKVVV